MLTFFVVLVFLATFFGALDGLAVFFSFLSSDLTSFFSFTLSSAPLYTVVAGTLGVTSDVAVNTNKFTVAASTGNTVVAGTLGVTRDLSVKTY